MSLLSSNIPEIQIYYLTLFMNTGILLILLMFYLTIYIQNLNQWDILLKLNQPAWVEVMN